MIKMESNNFLMNPYWYLKVIIGGKPNCSTDAHAEITSVSLAVSLAVECLGVP